MDPQPSVKVCHRPHFPKPVIGPSIVGDCKPLDCGGNSSVVNGFPINGFTKDGQGDCNPAGVQLLPGSLQGGGCGSGADLGLDPTGNRLIGTRGGQVACSGPELTGATFTVRSFAPATLTFTIAKVQQITMRGDDRRYEGYRIESGGASACEPTTARHIRRLLDLAPEDPVAPVRVLQPPDGDAIGASHPPPDLAIAVDGPLYDDRDQLIGDSREHWFNLACAGDALAKRTLYDLYDPRNDTRNDTALRMLTANYCGKPYTVPGIYLEWTIADKAFSSEAMWHAGKAVCIDTPRLTTLHVVEGGKPVSIAQLPAQLQPKGCEAHTCDAESWTKALRAECQLPPCSSKVSSKSKFEFKSYTMRGMNGIMVSN